MGEQRTARRGNTAMAAGRPPKDERKYESRRPRSANAGIPWHGYFGVAGAIALSSVIALSSIIAFFM